MSIKNRLDKLEQARGAKDGRCPGCGFRANDIRTIEFRLHPQCQQGELAEPISEPCPEFADQPGRPRCVGCGGYMPPVAIINVHRQASDGVRWTEP